MSETETTIPASLRDMLRNLRVRSIRKCQRITALFLADKAKTPHIDREDLRLLCRALRIYDTATFSYYMADTRSIHRSGGNSPRTAKPVSVPWFTEHAKGWNLTKAGLAEAALLKAANP